MYINICGWTRIPKPESDTHPIPIKSGLVQKFQSKKQQFCYVDVAVNDNVIKSSIEDKNFKEQVILLSMNYINDTTEWKLLPDIYEILQDKYYGDVTKILESLDRSKSHDKTTNTQSKVKSSSKDESDSLRDQLFSISANKDDRDMSTPTSFPGLSHLLNNTDNENKIESKKLIEEISSTIEQDASQNMYVKPQYRIQLNDDSPQILVVTINLPEVKSVQECELDISQVIT